MTHPDTIRVDDAAGTVDVPHWGITLRTLFGACLAAQPTPPPSMRQYTVRLKSAEIGTINVKQHDDFLERK